MPGTSGTESLSLSGRSSELRGDTALLIKPFGLPCTLLPVVETEPIPVAVGCFALCAKASRGKGMGESCS